MRQTPKNVGAAIQKAMRAIETANPDLLDGIFGDAPWTNRERLPDETLKNLIEHFSTQTLSVANVPEDELGNAYEYVLDINADGSPLTTAQIPRSERNHIHVHYLPARRDPADHIAYGANALLGRMLRAVNWDAERTVIKGLTDQISDSLAANPSINAFSTSLKAAWSALHKGSFFADPKLTFVASEVEALLRHMSVSFAPGHDEQLVDFSRLSDGQKSMLYLSLVLSSQAIGRAVLAEDDDSFDADKLRPPVFTVVAVEEPENSLSPHYLGRIVNALNEITGEGDAQALIATHAPSMLRRVAPERIRYLRLTQERTSRVTHIQLPDSANEAHKFVREAVQAFPEIYFSRLVVLGEGDSEEIVMPRLLQVKGAPVDESAVTIAPLGGRHVNHFWRLLSALQIPYLTLLDLDVDYLADLIEGWIKTEQFAPAEIAVLIRNQLDLYADHLMAALEARGIPFRNEQQMQDITVEPAARLIVDYLSCLYGQREPKAWIRLMNQLIPFADEEIQSNARKDLDLLVKQQRKEIAIAELVDQLFSGWWEYVRAFLKQVSIETLVSLSPDYESHDRLKEVIRDTKARIEELLKLEPDLPKALNSFSATARRCDLI